MSADRPPWAEPGVTDVAVARAFLATLRAPDTLALMTNDADGPRADPGPGGRLRGHGVTVAANVIAATPPPADLLAHHRSFGLAATRYFCPRAGAGTATLAELLLADAALVARLRADAALARVVVSYKSAGAARLVDALGLAPAFSAPTPAAYEAANDKLALARAGATHGFATLAADPVPDEAALAAAFRARGAELGAGCIVRPTRGTSGRDVHHAPTLAAARRIWRRLAADGRPVMLVPYVPPSRVRRNVAAHGIVTADGFAPFLFTDQIVRDHHFRGGRAVDPWSPAEIAAVRAGLAGVARWFRTLGYTDAPAGIDGFLVDGPEGPRFLVLDPNARFSATLGPWTAYAHLAEAAGRPFAWQIEGLRLIGGGLDVARMRRRLGGDWLTPAGLAGGGILPTSLFRRRLGPGATTHLWAMLLGHDAAHVAYLRRRLRRLALIAR